MTRATSIVREIRTLLDELEPYLERYDNEVKADVLSRHPTVEEVKQETVPEVEESDVSRILSLYTEIFPDKRSIVPAQVLGLLNLGSYEEIEALFYYVWNIDQSRSIAQPYPYMKAIANKRDFSAAVYNFRENRTKVKDWKKEIADRNELTDLDEILDAPEVVERETSAISQEAADRLRNFAKKMAESVPDNASE